MVESIAGRKVIGYQSQIIFEPDEPAADAPDEEPGPVYDEHNAPTFKDLVKAAHKARKGLKKLKP